MRFNTLLFQICIAMELLSCATLNSHESTLKIEKNLTFAKRDKIELLADWYHPLAKAKTGNRQPACVVIHGGGWYKGDKEDMDSVARRLAQAGIAALNINYRLAPSHRFPSPVYDTKDAIRWLKANASQLGVDPERICLFGYSAGAHLALMAGFTRPEDHLDDSDPAGATIVRYGTQNELIKSYPSDLRVRSIVAGGTPSDLTSGDYNKYYEKFFGRPPSEIPDIYKQASPVSFVRSGLPSVFLYHGNHDWVVDVEQSRRLAQKLKDQRVDVEYLEVTLGHVATFLFDEKEVLAAIKFLQKRLWVASDSKV